MHPHQTNYRVYAYTSSRIDLAILRFFTRPDYLLPNLYVGALTRESVVTAQRAGISGEQIVAYLRSHAHPKVAQRQPPVPDTVIDQVLLWAKGSQRLRGSPATLFDDFPSDEAFRLAKAHAQGLGVLLWEAPDGQGKESRMLVTTLAAKDSMREFFKAQREAGKVT